MPLPDDYLTYTSRQYGFDNGRYDWSPGDRRAALKLKSGSKAAVCIIVPLEFFPLNPPAEPFKHVGAMKTPYPDLRHFTVRDYGNRVGVYRLLQALKWAGFRATFPVQAEIARRYAPLIEAVQKDGHEIAAHGVSTAYIHHDGLSEADERALIAQTKAALPNATTWMSPARNESYRTPDLIAEAGYTVCLDWEADTRPLAFDVKSGQLTAIPNPIELSDVKLMMERQQSPDEWADQIIEAARFHMDAFHTEGATLFSFTLTPYIAGQPFRMRALKRILSELSTTNHFDVLTASEAATAFEEA